jgi:exosortase/archaeosortase family protein
MSFIIKKIKEYRETNAFYYYIISLFTIYAIWKFYKVIIYGNVKLLQDLGVIINYEVANFYVKFLSVLLNIFDISHETFFHEAQYGIYPAISLGGGEIGGVYVAYHCIGITVGVLYIFTICLLQGSIKRKIGFIIMGVVLIFLINAMRILAALFITKYASKTFFEINHSFVFVVLTYSTVFLIHLIYLKKYLIRNSKALKD